MYDFVVFFLRAERTHNVAFFGATTYAFKYLETQDQGDLDQFYEYLSTARQYTDVVGQTRTIFEEKSIAEVEELFLNTYVELDTEDFASEIVFKLYLLKDLSLFDKMFSIVNTGTVLADELNEIITQYNADNNNNDQEYVAELETMIGKIEVLAEDFSAEMADLADFVSFAGILVILIFILILFLFVFLISYIISRTITIPILKMRNSLGKVVDGDLTQKIQLDRKDEMGEFSKYFNNVVDYLNQMVNSIKESNEKSLQISKELSDNAGDANQVLYSMDSSIQEMKNQIISLESEIKTSSETVNRFKNFIMETIEQINTQVSTINESSASIEEMSQSIQNIANVSQDKIVLVDHLTNITKEGQKEMNNTINFIQKVSDSANEIMEIINVINGIAEQTDLLAMNASIEAAHAGDAGKGFSVVADEIRKLSNYTTQNAEEINASIKQIIEDIDISKHSTDNMGKHLTNMVQQIKDVANSMIEIKNGTVELSTGSKENIKALENIINTTNRVKSYSKEMENGVVVVNNLIENIQDLFTQTKQRMDTIIDNIGDLNNRIDLVSQSGDNNKASISELQNIVSMFRTENNGKGSFGSVTIFEEEKGLQLKT